MKRNATLATGRILVLILLVSVPMTGMAQKKTDFTGNWKLNRQESKLNPERSFAPHQINIAQDGTSINLEIMNNFQGNPVTRNEKVMLDGSESRNPGWRDTETVSVATWEDGGKKLTIVTTMETMNGGTMKITRKLSKENGSLFIQNSLEGGRGDSPPETWVFDKE